MRVVIKCKETGFSFIYILFAKRWHSEIAMVLKRDIKEYNHLCVICVSGGGIVAGIVDVMLRFDLACTQTIGILPRGCNR